MSAAAGLCLRRSNLSATISPDGEVALAGTARINDRLADIAAHAASLSRIHDDGSPFDLAFSVPELAIQFNGRLATAHIPQSRGHRYALGRECSLCGPVDGSDTGAGGGPLALVMCGRDGSRRSSLRHAAC